MNVEREVKLAATDVSEVVVVLARRASTESTGRTVRRLATALRRINGVAPIVPPPPRA